MKIPNLGVDERLKEEAFILREKKPDMVVYICDPSSWEAEAGRILNQGQSGLHSETLSQETQSWGCVLCTRPCI
jgi:hypothetical protein